MPCYSLQQYTRTIPSVGTYNHILPTKLWGLISFADCVRVGQAGVPLDELLRFTAEEVTELLKEMKVGVVARRKITEEHALEAGRYTAGEAGARAREQLVRTGHTYLLDSRSLLRCLALPHALCFLHSFLAFAFVSFFGDELM